MAPRFPHLARLWQVFRPKPILKVPPKVVLPKGFFSPSSPPPPSIIKPALRIPHLSRVKVRLERGFQIKFNLRLASLFTLLLFLYLLFFSPVFVLKKVEVRNNHLVSQERILEAAFPDGFKAGRYLLLPEGKVKRRLLKNLLQIEKVILSRHLWLRSLILTVTERATAIIWQTNNEQFLINREGIVYDYAPLESPLPLVVDLKNVPVDLGQRVVSREFVDFVVAVASNFSAKAQTTIIHLTIPETTFEMEVETAKGFKVIFDTTRSPDIQLDNLVRLLQVVGEAPLQYVDLRIEDRIYYK